MRVSKRVLPILAWFTIGLAGTQIGKWAVHFGYTADDVAFFVFLLGGVAAIGINAKLGFEQVDKTNSD